MTGRDADDDARLRVYELRREPFTALQAWLDQVQAFWNLALQYPKIFGVVVDDPFDLWCERSPEVFGLTSAS